MHWLLAALLCLLLVELIVRLPFRRALSGLHHASDRALWTLRARAVSDHWKERAMGAYARSAFLSTMRLALLLLIVAAVLAALVTVMELGFHGFQGFLLGWQGIAGTIVLASVYVIMRRVVLRGRL